MDLEINLPKNDCAALIIELVWNLVEELKFKVPTQSGTTTSRSLGARVSARQGQVEGAANLPGTNKRCHNIWCGCKAEY
jgi:hypothetical protein